MLLLTTIVIPLLAVLVMSVVDYNRFIQIPYWTIFSSCYLISEYAEISMCDGSHINQWGDWTISKWNWELENVKPDSNDAIPELAIGDFSFDSLKKLSKDFTIPVVIRGLFNNTPAVNNWNAEYFEEKYGEETLITITNAVVGDQYKTTAQKGVHGYQKSMNVVKMKLKNTFKHMQQGEKFYISNIDTIFRKHNDLLDDLSFEERIKPWAYDPYRPYAAQLFLGYGSKDAKSSTGTLFHSAFNANLFVQVHGTKHWKFILPRYSMFIRPELGGVVPAAKAGIRPENVPTMNVAIHAGDCLFNPPFMWHEITNGDGLVIGVATRENHPAWIARNNFLFQALHELRVTPKISKLNILKDKKSLLTIASIPFFSFGMSYLIEAIKGPRPHPFFTAGMNPCDEHDPTGCSSSILDKVVFDDTDGNIQVRD